MTTDMIDQLDQQEKIALINTIWESLDKEDAQVSSPQWHEKVIEQRLAKITNGEAKFIDLHDLKS